VRVEDTCPFFAFLHVLYIEAMFICAYSTRGVLLFRGCVGSAPNGRSADGGLDRRSVPGRVGPGQVLRGSVGPGETVMLWLGMIVSVGLLVYLCVALFDAENF
jgi:K+-transporting ATPase KdpF subunit